MARGNPSHSLTTSSKICFKDGTFRTPRSKNKFMDSSLESGGTLTTLQSNDIQTSIDQLVNTNLLPLLEVGLGIPTSARENFFQTSSKINRYLLCPNLSINTATRSGSDSGRPTIFIASARFCCNLGMSSSFETVTQMILSNKVVFSIPPIPHTPIIPISSLIK
ncbi:hypothetical protein ES288_D01G049700v1 [Gossypium darwinii]|uniref:Uncharacterized protein n=2 Tax=Gossypium TaxID=3633 RepID=A0A5D2M549_GOSTO|nr:hypothetical protein ES288_D01G049700v1 [Gossypium darwinii]TYH86501.1 hypothetical protein ES332_D01G047500v1 [Gossypium tomentosum]